LYLPTVQTTIGRYQHTNRPIPIIGASLEIINVITEKIIQPRILHIKILQTRRCSSQAFLLLLPQLFADSRFLHHHFPRNFHRPLDDLFHKLGLNLLDVVCRHVAILAISTPSTPPVVVRFLYQLKLLNAATRSILIFTVQLFCTITFGYFVFQDGQFSRHRILPTYPDSSSIRL